MNNTKTLEKTLQPYIEKALQALEKGADFVIDEAPELVQEFYLYHWWVHCIGSIIGIMLLIYSVIAMRYGFKTDDYNDIALPNFLNISGMLCFAGSLAFLLVNIVPFIKINIAPKLYLIEYFIN